MTEGPTGGIPSSILILTFKSELPIEIIYSLMDLRLARMDLNLQRYISCQEQGVSIFSS